MATKLYKSPDHRAFKKKGSKPDRDGLPEGYWWTHTREEACASVTETLERIKSQQGARNLANARFVRMYGDAALVRETSQRLPQAPPRGRPTLALPQAEKLTYNLARVVVATACARIAKSRPKVTALTSGGNWKQQQQAKQLDKFLRGAFYSTKAPLKGRQAFRDACVTDVGVLKVFRREGRLCLERVLPGELYVDEMDGLYGEPRSLYQVKAMPREVVMALFGKDEASRIAIRNAASPDTVASSGMLKPHEKLTDFVQVVEAWHLPSSKKAGDGLHVICLDSVTLVHEEWKRPRFPFAFVRWEESVAGFFGKGLVEQVAGDQVFINKTLQTIQRILHLCSVPRVLWPTAAGVPEEHYSNQIGSFIKFNGPTPPTVVANNAVPPELFQALEQAIQRGMAKVGISQLSASGQKVPGLNSGVAIREQQDVETDRFSLQAQDYEGMFLELAEVMVDEAEEASAAGEDLEVEMPTGKGQVERLTWKDVDLDREAFALQLFPTSSLPQTPAARKQTVTEWQQAGWIDATEARRLMDIPDLEASNNMALAAYEDIESTIQDLLDGKPMKPPEPFQDLALGTKRAQQAYLQARRLGAPKEVLTNLRDWWNAAQDVLQQMAPPAPPMAPPGAAPQGPPPGAPPMPMPQAA